MEEVLGVWMMGGGGFGIVVLVLEGEDDDEGLEYEEVE